MPPAEPGTRRGATRITPRWLIGAAAVLLLARVVAGFVAERNPGEPVGHVSWRPAAAALDESHTSGKPLFYDFTAAWCPPCRVLNREVFADRKSAETINSMFVPVRVLDRAREDGRNSLDVVELQARYRVTAFPTLVIVDPRGGQPVVIEGYPGRQRLMEQLVMAGVRSRMRGLPGAAGGGDSLRR